MNWTPIEESSDQRTDDEPVELSATELKSVAGGWGCGCGCGEGIAIGVAVGVAIGVEL